MAEEKNKDLTTEELLKKLMESFGEEEQPAPDRQVTLEESASSRRKIYRKARLANKNDEPDDAEETSEPDDGISERLAQSIANAERYVSRMDADGRVRDEEPGEEPAPEETEAEEARPEKETENETEDETENVPVIVPLSFDAPAGKDGEPEEPGEPVDEPVEEESAEAPAEEEPAEEEPANEPVEEESAEEEPEEDAPAVVPVAVPLSFNGEPKAAEEDEPAPEESEPAQQETPAAAPVVDDFVFDDDRSAEGSEPAEEETVEDLPEEPEEPEPEEAPEEEVSEEEPAEDEEDDLMAFPLFGSSLPESAPQNEPAETGEEEAEEEADEEDAESEEEEKGAEEPDDDEAHLMMIFGREKELGEKIGPEGVEKLRREMDLEDEPEPEQKKKKEKKQKEPEEYTSRDQNEAIFAKFRKAYTALSVRLVLAVLFFLVIAVFEVGPYFAGGKEQFFVGPFLTLFKNPVYTALLGLQTTVLLAVLSIKEVIAGLRAVRSGRSSPELFLILSLALTLIYEAGLLYCHSVNAQLYNLPAALAVCLAIYFTRVNLKNDLLSFKIISSKKPKYAIRSLDEGEATLEKEAFENYTSDLSNIYGVEKTDFVSGYAKRVSREPKFLGVSGIFATVVLVIAIVFFLLGYYFAPAEAISAKQKILSALTSSILAALFCTPLSAFISFSFPLFKAAKKAFALDSAIVGAASTEEYANATVISFEDKDIFPAKNVRVRSLKLFADSRIDHVLFGAASVFRKLGGPLDEVFAVATKESGVTDEVDILHVGAGGVEAAVKGVNVNIGSFAYMRDKGLISVSNDADDALELEGRVRIMYLALGRELAAKMYIEYKADKEFNDLMSSLYKSGMCIGIRTLDPNIDDRMMRLHVDLGKYPVRILRMEKADDEKVKKTMSSGVVSKKSTKNLLKTLTFCRRVLQVIRAATILKVLSIVCGVAVSGLLLAMSLQGKLDGIYSVNALWMTLYQACWAALAALIALLFA